jgi:rare lipoprotein A
MSSGRNGWSILLATAVGLGACKAVQPSSASPGQKGIASWYGGEFKRTASGERYDPNSMTAAHRTLPFGTRVRVTHLKSQRSVVVRINNRGPYTRGRVIDLSNAAARELNMVKSGVARVEVQVLPAKFKGERKPEIRAVASQ